VRRIARRSIPFVSGERRGLLFQSYQAHLAEQFEFILLTWFAGNDSPEPGAGHDPLLQPPKGTTPQWPKKPDGVKRVPLSLQRFIRIIGGAYFYTPSIPFLWRLGQI
jgi:deferrochelatase/peroxidase EfeB